MNKRYCFLMLFVGVHLLWAQDEADASIGTQQVTVIKSYTPSLSDAFKLRSNPVPPDSLLQKKQSVEYPLIDVPVVSTFVPNKATPLKLTRRTSETPYNSFFSLGLGNHKQVLFDVSSVVQLDRNQSLGIWTYRDGFGGAVPNTIFQSRQNEFFLGGHHTLKENSFIGISKLNFESLNTAYYGLYDMEWDPLLINAVDPDIKRQKVALQTDWLWYDSLLRKLEFKTHYVADNFRTAEQLLYLKTQLRAELFEGDLDLTAQINGSHTRFESDYFTKEQVSKTLGLGTVGLQWTHLKNDLKIKVGATGSYVVDPNDASENKITYYPNIDLSYQTQKSKIIPYLNAQGNVRLNSYSEHYQENPFLAPTIDQRYSWGKYNTHLGIRSTVSSILGFDFSLYFDQVDQLALYQRLPFDPDNKDLAYRLSNAYNLIYSDVWVYGLKTQFKIQLGKENHLGFHVNYTQYDTIDNKPLWNIPNVTMRAEGQIKWSNKWVFSFDASFLGDRKGAAWDIFLTQTPEEALQRTPPTVNLPPYLTGQAQFTYKIKPQIDVFAKARYNSESVHGRWAFYPQHSLFVLLGASYKFDFQF